MLPSIFLKKSLYLGRLDEDAFEESKNYVKHELTYKISERVDVEE